MTLLRKLVQSHEYYKRPMAPGIKKKYKINELLDKLPVKENKKALAILPDQLGISVATFNNYRNIGIEDSQDIPHIVVASLERFFGVHPGDLQNFQITIRPLSDIDINQLEMPLVGKFSLSKKPKTYAYDDQNN